MTKTSIVILNFNGKNLLRQFLPSVIQHSKEAEIVVADNGSTDQSLFVLKSEFPQVRIIALEKNYGFCGGYNRALKQVQADYYLLLNSDVEVTEGWLKPLTNMLDRDPTIAAVQPKILSYQDRNKFEYAGAAGGFIDTLGYPFCRGRVFQYVEQDIGQYDDEREIFWATGACFLIRSKIYHHFNGLDEDFFAHMEEIDLCWKMNRASYKICYSGKSKVYHKGAGTLEYENPFKTYLNFRNGLMLIFKHLNTPELVYKLPFRMMLDWFAAVVFFAKGNRKNAASIFRAHWHFLRHMRRLLQKRSSIQSAFPTYSKANVHPGLIIFDYYLHNRKRLKSIVPDRATFP
jgi:GT2 family glycosyltransferase